MAPPPTHKSAAPGAYDARLNVLGHVASAVVHSVINRISAVVSQAEILKTRNFPPQEVSRQADAIIRAALQGATLARRLAEYSRGPEVAEQDVVDLDVLIASHLDCTFRDCLSIKPRGGAACRRRPEFLHRMGRPA